MGHFYVPTTYRKGFFLLSYSSNYISARSHFFSETLGSCSSNLRFSWLEQRQNIEESWALLGRKSHRCWMSLELVRLCIRYGQFPLTLAPLSFLPVGLLSKLIRSWAFLLSLFRKQHFSQTKKKKPKKKIKTKKLYNATGLELAW